MKNSIYLLGLAITLSFSSCMKQYVDDADAILGPNDYEQFDMNTIENQLVTIQLSTASGEPLTQVLLKIWSQSPKTGGQVIFKGLTNNNGIFSNNINLPTTIQEVILETNYIGVADFIILSRADLANEVVIQGMAHAYQTLPDDQVSGRSANTENAQQSNSARIEANYSALGTYDSQGVPDYLLQDKDVISSELLSFINASLPENQPVPTYHPKFIVENAETNLHITDLADVWMTFVHEGAGYKNILGYYTYPTNQPPTSIDDIETVHIAFPNASFIGSGGGLTTGDKVNLGRFEAGTSLGFALLANGWNGSITPGRHQVFSNPILNPESTPEKRRHSVLLWDAINKLFLVGFEDLNRDQGSDDDFNDAIFYITANPIESINLENINPIDEPTDRDGDGVSDVYDEYPDDAKYAYSYKYPGDMTYGTFAFEDQWPRMGDYDFNDLVVDYQYNQFANANNKMVALDATFVIKAVGAGFSNGFGVQLDIAPSSISSTTGQRISSSYLTLQANGTEASQTKAVIIASDNVHQGFEGNGFINTSQSLGYQTPDTILLNIAFSSPISLSGAGSAPFNPFLIINKERGREVHMPGYDPTDLVDTSLFGTFNDQSDPTTNLYFQSKEGLPWGMNLPVSFDYPTEKQDIRGGYNHFNSWARSRGFSYMDWYTDKLNYRNSNKIFPQP